ncbi:MAG: hypothetical protein QOH47_1825 [Sphingomonadales bacterium]|jgi:hypothetical protein|nr:hypothetical protein [Sphingomonadales bacterium]
MAEAAATFSVPVEAKVHEAPVAHRSPALVVPAHATARQLHVLHNQAAYHPSRMFMVANMNVAIRAIGNDHRAS